MLRRAFRMVCARELSPGAEVKDYGVVTSILEVGGEIQIMFDCGWGLCVLPEDRLPLTAYVQEG